MLSRFLDHQRNPAPVGDRINSASDDSFKFSANVLAENDNCGLCKEPLIFSSASTLPCGHVFHDDCVEVLRSYGVLSHACPTCRPSGANKGPPQLNEEASRIYIVVERRVHRGEAKWDSLSPDDRSSVDEATKLWEEAAGLGNLNAQNNMGLLHLHGRGVTKDCEKARLWFKRAADHGFPEAQFNLGALYLSGLGVAQNDKETVLWYRRAADQGHTFALLELGDMYEKGRGVRASDSEAARCWRKAAYQGIARAQYNIGVMYREGRGVEQSFLDAGRWYTKAAYQGFSEAQYDLGVMYDQGEGVDQSAQEAIRWWMKAADKGHARAMAEIGLHFHEGNGVEASYTQAVWWWSQAADLGNSMAQCNLGCMLYEGIGVAQDRTRARSLLESAEAQGDELAKQALRTLIWEDDVVETSGKKQPPSKLRPPPRPRSKRANPSSLRSRTLSSTISTDSLRAGTASRGTPVSISNASTASGLKKGSRSPEKVGKTNLKPLPPKPKSRDPRKLVRKLL